MKIIVIIRLAAFFQTMCNYYYYHYYNWTLLRVSDKDGHVVVRAKLY